jgi:hypothetical protein
MYPAPIIKTSEDFSSEEPQPKKSPPTTKDASLPGQLSRPPIPEYAHEEIFSGQLLEGGRSGEA